MDEPDNFSLASGTDGHAGEPANGSDGNAGSDSIIAGRIDPTIAIAASGGGNAGSSGNGGPGSGKRGRHPRECTCNKCVARAGEPKPVEEKTRNIRASFVEKTLVAIHLGLVAVTKCPEFSLEGDDAKKLGDATAQVLSYYKVKMTAKQEAYALLLEAAAQVYPPMIVSIYIRKKMEAEDARKRMPPAPKPTPAPMKPESAKTPIHIVKPGEFNPADIRIPDGA